MFQELQLQFTRVDISFKCKNFAPQKKCFIFKVGLSKKKIVNDPLHQFFLFFFTSHFHSISIFFLFNKQACFHHECFFLLSFPWLNWVPLNWIQSFFNKNQIFIPGRCFQLDKEKLYLTRTNRQCLFNFLILYCTTKILTLF